MPWGLGGGGGDRLVPAVAVAVAVAAAVAEVGAAGAGRTRKRSMEAAGGACAAKPVAATPRRVIVTSWARGTLRRRRARAARTTAAIQSRQQVFCRIWRLIVNKLHRRLACTLFTGSFWCCSLALLLFVVISHQHLKCREVNRLGSEHVSSVTKAQLLPS